MMPKAVGESGIGDGSFQKRFDQSCWHLAVIFASHFYVRKAERTMFSGTLSFISEMRVKRH